MRSGAVKANVATGFDSYLSTGRQSINYGGLVGDLLVQLEALMAECPSSGATMAQPCLDIDVIHAGSIVAGYIGLALGLALSGATLLWLVS